MGAAMLGGVLTGALTGLKADLGPAMVSTLLQRQAVWRSRHRGVAPEGEQEQLARELQPLLGLTLKHLLGGP